MLDSNKIKRFYKTATVAKADTGWRVELDGRSIKTPARVDLTVPTRKLAEAIAAEWAAQEKFVDIPAMHLTRLINVAIDRTPVQRDAMAEEFVRYCETDLLCFLAESPEDLREQQIDAWRPVREAVGKATDIVLMEVPGGLLAAPQPPASLEAARAYAGKLDDYTLTGLAYGLGLFGSALLSVAAVEGVLAAEDAYETSVLDELYQAETWGQDAENEARLASNRAQAMALSNFFSALSEK